MVPNHFKRRLLLPRYTIMGCCSERNSLPPTASSLTYKEPRHDMMNFIKPTRSFHIAVKLNFFKLLMRAPGPGLDPTSSLVILIGRRGRRRSVRDVDGGETLAVDLNDTPDIETKDIDEQILAVLKRKGITQFTPIQAQTYDHILAGRDMIARSRTGTYAPFLPF